MGLFSLKKVFLWSLGIPLFWGLTGCFAPPAFNGGSPSEPIGNSDYEQDRVGRKEFPKDYLKITPRIGIPDINPGYQKSIPHTVSQIIWDQGFRVDSQGILGKTWIWHSRPGVDPGDLQADGEGDQLTMNFYDQEGKRYLSDRGVVGSYASINLNTTNGRYFNQTLRSLVLFTQKNGTRGYTQLPPVYIQTF